MRKQKVYHQLEDNQYEKGWKINLNTQLDESIRLLRMEKNFIDYKG